MTIKTSPSKHPTRLVLGLISAVGAIYIDKGAQPDERAFLQMALWTFFLFAISIAELRESLKRRIQKYIAAGLGALHILFLFLIRDMFPLQSSLFILAGLLPEALVLVFLYIRIGQSLDLTGPFGLTEEGQKSGVKRLWK
jgi:hypothetical protein